MRFIAHEAQRGGGGWRFGQGTTFWIYLPLSDVTVEVEATDSKPLPRGQGEAILLVEDEDTVLQTTSSMLQSIGNETVVAHNGYQALDVYRERPDIALVLSDMVMPEMGGVGLHQALQEQEASLPVVLMSGYATGLA